MELNNKYNIQLNNNGSTTYLIKNGLLNNQLYLNSLENFAADCTSLSLNLQNFELNISKATSMHMAFTNCRSITGSPICGDNVTDMYEAYQHCESLTGDAICGPNVTNMSEVYTWCYNLNGSPTCSDSVLDMYEAYAHCNSLTGDPVCGEKVENFSGAYSGCTSLTGQPVCGNNVINMVHAYSKCSQITGSPVCGPNVTYMSYAYYGCRTLTGSPVCGDAVTSFDQAYESCTGLTGSPVCGNNVYYMYRTYYGCANLTGAPVVGPNVYFLNEAYYGCPNLTGTMYWNYNGGSQVNCGKAFCGHDNNYRINISCLENSNVNKALYKSAGSGTNSIFGTSFSWTNTNIGYYNTAYNMYVYYKPATITYNLTNVTGDETNPTEIKFDEVPQTMIFTAPVGYELPEEITVLGAMYTWDQTTGTIIILDVYDDLQVTISGIKIPNELCFKANTANSTVELVAVGSPAIANTAYSTDGITWITFTPSTAGTNKITLVNVGDKVYFRNDIIGDCSYSDYIHFTTTGSVAASGNCNSIYSSTNFEDLTTLSYAYCFCNLFYANTSLTMAPELPAIALSSRCYDGMFEYCNSLTTAPVLPATTLAEGCYYHMFIYCSALVDAPSLPAVVLTETCYREMFANCTSLEVPPALPATTLALNCYNGMFVDCTALKYVPNLPATAMVYSTADGCYYNMFYNCTSLQVSDTQTEEALYEWIIPSSGVITDSNNKAQKYMFTNCAGTRSSDHMPGKKGYSYTYYTQNEPV